MGNNKIIISVLMSLLLIFSTSGSAFAGEDISVAFNTNTANVGDQVNLIVNITNTGPGDLSGIVVSAPIPAGLKFLNTSTGTVQNNYNSTTGVWDVGNLKLSSQGGGKKSLNITVEVMSEAAGKTITANASYLNVTDSSGSAELKSAQSQALNIKGNNNASNASNTSNASNNTPLTTYILVALAVVIIVAIVGYLFMRNR
jgi:uncharacterized repeat protein (TIGR01451 family)